MNPPTPVVAALVVFGLACYATAIILLRKAFQRDWEEHR